MHARLPFGRRRGIRRILPNLPIYASLLPSNFPLQEDLRGSFESWKSVFLGRTYFSIGKWCSTPLFINPIYAMFGNAWTWTYLSFPFAERVEAVSRQILWWSTTCKIWNNGLIWVQNRCSCTCVLILLSGKALSLSLSSSCLERACKKKDKNPFPSLFQSGNLAY